MIKIFLSARLAFIAATASFLFMSPAFADQAAVLTSVDANSAVSILKEQKTILDYCEPCSGSKRTEVTVKSVDTVRFQPKDPQNNEWIVRVNGKEIDLAYTFISRYGAWENLAGILNIDVYDVSYTLPLNERKGKSKKSR